jgi:hypothetical protein
VIVEIVEADFAPGDDFGVLREASKFVEVVLCDFFGFVRMDADAGVDPIVLLGVGDDGVEFSGPGPVPMARRVEMPASRARSSMASRSSANCGKSMWAWESISSIKSEATTALEASPQTDRPQ